jgi:hypothetical protein
VVAEDSAPSVSECRSQFPSARTQHRDEKARTNQGVWQMKQRGCMHRIIESEEFKDCHAATVDGCNYCEEHLPVEIAKLRVAIDRDERWLNQKKEQLLDLINAKMHFESAPKANPHGKSEGKNLTRR